MWQLKATMPSNFVVPPTPLMYKNNRAVQSIQRTSQFWFSSQFFLRTLKESKCWKNWTGTESITFHWSIELKWTELLIYLNWTRTESCELCWTYKFIKANRFFSDIHKTWSCLSLTIFGTYQRTVCLQFTAFVWRYQCESP